MVWLAAAADAGDAGLAAATRLLEVVQQVARWPEPPPRLAIVTRSAFAARRAPIRPRYGPWAAWSRRNGRSCASRSWMSRTTNGRRPGSRAKSSPNPRSGGAAGAGGPARGTAPAVECAAATARGRFRGGAPGHPAAGPCGLPDSLTWHEFRATEPGPGQLEIRTTGRCAQFQGRPEDDEHAVGRISRAHVLRRHARDGDSRRRDPRRPRRHRLPAGGRGRGPVAALRLMSHRPDRPGRARPSSLAPIESPVFIN